MPFATKNDVASGRVCAPTAADSCVVAPRFTQACVAADSALNNIGVIGILPAGYTPALPLVVATAGLGGTAAVSIGLLDEATGDISVKPADGGAAWATAVAVGTAAVASVPPTAALLAVTRSNVDRKIVVKFTTAGSAAGSLSVIVPYAA